MAKYEKDFWGNGHLDVTDEVRHARRDEKFREDMGRIGQSFDSDMAAGVRNGVVGTAALGAGSVAVGVAAKENLRFRYKLQAFLHFLFAFIVSGIVCVNVGMRFVSEPEGYSVEAQAAYDERLASAMLIGLAISAVVSIVWTIIYVQKRTKPKLRSLGY